jgi:hypothetical protein
MISLDEFGAILDKVAMGIPQELYQKLNGGILLLPEIKLHPENRGNPNMYIMGQYCCSYIMGRYIEIYYGSFMQMFEHLTIDALKEELRRVLIHEFTHHIESLAGEYGLEIKDAQQIAKYKKKYEEN